MAFFPRIVCRLVWNITIVDDSMSKQFSKEKGDKMSALPATAGGLSVDIPVGTVRRALAIAELSDSDIVSITISLERLVDLTQTVAGLVGQQLDEAVGQEKVSSDVEPGDGSGNRGAAICSGRHMWCGVVRTRIWIRPTGS